MNSFTNKVVVKIDYAPKTTRWENHVIQYRITIYRNILRGFETYCN